MSMIPALSYISGFAVLGWIGWILGGIKDDIIDVGIHETGTIWGFMGYAWTAVFIIYTVFGGYYVIRLYNEQHYQKGGF